MFVKLRKERLQYLFSLFHVLWLIPNVYSILCSHLLQALQMIAFVFTFIGCKIFFDLMFNIFSRCSIVTQSKMLKIISLNENKSSCHVYLIWRPILWIFFCSCKPETSNKHKSNNVGSLQWPIWETQIPSFLLVSETGLQHRL